MAQVIGHVKSIEGGSFFVKDTKGQVHKLKSGEAIHNGELVYGDSSNIQNAQIIIDVTLKGAGDIVIGGNGVLAFDTSLLEGVFTHHDAVVYINSIQNAMAALGEKETVAKADDIVINTDTDETNAGETAAGNTVTDTERAGDVFADRTGAVGDVSTVLAATDTTTSTTLATDTTNPIILNANTPISADNTVTVKLVAWDTTTGTELSASAIAEGQTAAYKIVATDGKGNTITNGTADLTFTNGTTQGASDYTATNQTGVAFGSVISASAVDDMFKENPEAFTVTMSNVSAPTYEKVVVGNTTVSTTITDEGQGNYGPEDTVTFKLFAVDALGNLIGTSTMYEPGEGTPNSAYYVVKAVDASGNAFVTQPSGTVNVSYTDSGATSGSDYTPSVTTVNVNTVFSASALDDVIADNGETFTVSLTGGYSNAAAYEAISYDSATVTTTINDNDPAPIVTSVISDDDNVNENTDSNPNNNIVQIGTIQNIGASDVVTLSGSTSITSNNKTVTYAWDTASKTLTASSSEGTVFTVKINANNTAYTFTQLKAIDHLATVQGEAELKILDFKLAVEGGVSPASFTVSVYDDAPTVSGTLSISTDNDGSFTQTGILTQAVVSNDITSVEWNINSLPTNLVYQGKAISYLDLGNGILEGRTVSTDSSTAIFRAKIDPSVVNDSGNPTYTFELLQPLNTNGQIGFIDSDTAYTIIGGGNVNEKNIQFGGYLIQNMTGFQADGTISQVNTNQNWVGVGSGGGPGNWFESGEYLVMKFYEPDNSTAEVRNLGIIVEGNGSASYSLNWTVTVAIDAAGNTTQYSGTFNGTGNNDVSFNIPLMNGALYFTEAKIENTSGNFRINFSGAVANNYFEDIALPLGYTLIDADGDRASGSIDVTLNAPSRVEITGIGVTSGDETVYESNLIDGSSPDTASLTQTGNFNITATEGITSLMIGSTSLTLAQVQSLGTTSVQVDTTYGLLMLNGYSGNTKGGIISYSYVLQDNVDNDTVGTSTGYVESLNVKLTDTTGANSTTTLNFNIVDDAPKAVSLVEGIEIPQVNHNVLIVLDMSTSMTFNSNANLNAAKSAISQLLTQYENMGDVKVQLVTFGTNASTPYSSWMTTAEVNTYIQGLSVSGTQYTNYDAAIESAMNAFATNGKLAGANNVSYFLTDGEPTAWVGYSDGRLTNNTLYDTGNSTATYTNANINPTTTDAGLEDNEVGSNGLTWTQFLNNNDVNSYAIGFGGASTAQAQLAPIAYNGTGLGSDPAGNVLVSPSLSDLTKVLLSTVPSVVNGSLLTGTTPGLIGADGGFVSSLSANGKVYTWDQSTDTFSAPGATSSDYSWDTSTNTVSIYMTSGGKFEVVLDTGAYKYWAPTSGTTDVIGFTLKDNDGDTSSGTLNLVSSNTKVQTLIGTSGDDVLIGNDGADSISGGAGNDTLVSDISTSGSVLNGDSMIDGGSGIDTLILTAGSDIDFSVLGDIIHNIEVIDLTQNGAHKLNGLTVQDVFDMTDSTHTLTIFGDSADTVTLVNPADLTDTAHTWTLTAENVIENGHTLDIYKSGDNSVTLKIEDTTVHTIA